MPPVELNQRTGRPRKWKRSLKLVDRPALRARDDAVSDNLKRFPGAPRGGARIITSRQSGTGAGVGDGGAVDGDGESDGIPGDDSADELDDDISDSDNDGIESGDDSPPSTPVSDVTPTLTLSSPPGVGATIVPLPSDLPLLTSRATASTVVDTTANPEPTVILTPIIVS